MGWLQRCLSHLHPGFERESRRWYVRCRCGAEPDIWEMGGVRWGALGHPRRLVKCPHCQTRSILKLRLREKRSEDGSDPN